MQYAVSLDGERIYHSRLKRDALRIMSGRVTREINTSGKLVMTISEENHLYDKPRLMASKMAVMRWSNSASRTDCLFCGRPIQITLDSYNNKTIVCEGYAGTLNDSVVTAFTKTGTRSAILAEIINKHNTFTGNAIGISYNSTDTTTATFKVTSEQTAMDTLQQFCDDFNCVWYPTYTEDGGCSIAVYDKDALPSTRQSHGISYGANLISIETEGNGSDMFTDIYPIGTNNVKLASTTAQVTSDVKREGYMLKSAQALADIGYHICKIVHFDVASTSAELQNIALKYIERNWKGTTETNIKAYDTGDFDGLTNFEMLVNLPFSSPVHAPHNPELSYTVVKLVNNLCDPSQDTVEVGDIRKTLTSMI